MLSNILRAVRRWWWLLLLAAAVAAVSAYRSAADTPRYYRAGATVLVGRLIQQSNPNTNAFSLLDRLTGFYANIATRQPVIDAAARSLSPPTTADAIAPRVQARAISGTQFIEITYLDINPERAAAVTNAIATELIRQSPTPDALQSKQQAKFTQDQLDDLQAKISETQAQLKKLDSDIAGSSSAAEIADARDKAKQLQAQVDGWRTTYTNLLLLTQPSDTNYLSIIEPAAIPSVPVASSRLFIIGIGSVLGLVLAFGGVLVIEYFDDTLRKPQDVPVQTRLPLLATIGRRRRKGGEAAAPFRALRNALLEQPQTPLRVLIAAPQDKLETAPVAIGLAEAFARAGRRVVLVDGRFTRPSIHTALDVPAQPGLLEMIVGTSDASTAIYLPDTRLPNLMVVPAGDTSGDDDALGAPGVLPALDALIGVADADVLLVDGGALGDPTHTSRVLARYLGQTVLVVNSRTRASRIHAIVAALSGSGTQILGLVFTSGRADTWARTRRGRGKLARAPRAALSYFGVGTPAREVGPKGHLQPAGAFAVTPMEPLGTAPDDPTEMITEG